MATALSIHIGLNGVDPSAYNGWAGTLSGCVNDANAMKAIADSLSFTSTLLLDQSATSSAVIQAIGAAAQQLNSGDILFVSYSGHGGIVDDATGGEPGDGGKDETWVLYDRMVLDDELQQLWRQFCAGVRIFVLSDSCHSGTVTRDYVLRSNPPVQATKPASSKAVPQLSPKEQFYLKLANAGALGTSRGKPVFRMIPPDVQDAHYQKNKDVYSTRQWAAVTRTEGETGATVLLISGCQDNQVSMDGDGNGLFTGTLLQVWNNGNFTGTYQDFHSEITAKMPPTQTPNFFLTGPDYPGFTDEQPFAIDRSTASGNGAASTQAGRPTIQSPDSADRAGDPPTFTVDVNGNQYYVVEVATDSSLFANSGGRTDDIFYASWQDDSNNHISGSNTTYTLPASVWSRLNAADRLYYRMISTSSASGWDNYIYSTEDSDAAQAPSLEITGARAAKKAVGGQRNY
jgi:hypothetical protein